MILKTFNFSVAKISTYTVYLCSLFALIRNFRFNMIRRKECNQIVSNTLLPWTLNWESWVNAMRSAIIHLTIIHMTHKIGLMINPCHSA